MNSEQIFGIALGLKEPWQIQGIDFKEGENGGKELHLTIGFPRGSKFKDLNGKECSVYDTVPRTWQHLNFFQHLCFIHCRVPRIKDKGTGKVKQVSVPWSRANSGFTLLFEAFAMALIEREMPVNKVAEILQVYPKRLWTIFNYWINIAYQADDQKEVTVLGIDETSSKKGHEYVTIAVDMDKRRVLHATEGKGKETLTKIREHLGQKGVNPEQIKNICMDMSPSFIAGAIDEFPKSAIVFDRFHIVKLLNEAMDDVRKKERIQHQLLKNHRYTFLKNERNLSSKQKEQRDEILELLPVIGEAYRFRELFNDLWDFDKKEQAAGFLAFWCDLVEESKIIPFKKFVKTIKAHWSGITNYFDSKISNGVLEGINNKIQLAKRRARGYRNINNFINMIYFIAGKLKFNYPQYLT
jgi:transposase